MEMERGVGRRQTITHCELDSQDPRKTEAGELESFKGCYLYVSGIHT